MQTFSLIFNPSSSNLCFLILSRYFNNVHILCSTFLGFFFFWSSHHHWRSLAHHRSDCLSINPSPFVRCWLFVDIFEYVFFPSNCVSDFILNNWGVPFFFRVFLLTLTILRRASSTIITKRYCFVSKSVRVTRRDLYSATTRCY